MRHPGAQWGRPPSPADCNFHSRWLQNAFHELSETPFLLNALPNLRGFRGTLCSSTARLVPCQQLNVETPCCWSLWVGHILLLIFCKLWKGCICVMAMIPIKLESFWEHFSRFEIPSSGLGEDRPVSLCWNIYTSHLSVALANSLTPGVCQRKRKRKSCRETLIFMLNFMFERTFLSCYFWLCAATGKEVHEKCSGKYVLINVLFGRQNLCWRGGKRKKIPFFTKKIPKYLPLG